MRASTPRLTRVTRTVGLLSILAGGLVPSTPAEEPSAPETHTVRGRVQLRPGGPVVDGEFEVHAVPTDLPTVGADAAPLEDDDLVLGIVVEDSAVAFPIRFLAMFEIIDHRVGDTPLAPSW